MTVPLIDTHCHLDLEAFDPDRSEVLQHSRALGVTDIVVPGIQADGWPALLALCRREAGLYPALGLHPMFLDRHGPGDLKRLEEAVAVESPVAVGEIGLDYYRGGEDRAGQEALFEAQLVIAREAGLPVILHVRKAHEQVLALLKRRGVRGGIAHAFGGSREQAERYLELGFKLGVGGALTYERSKILRRLVTELPLEAWVLETDAPDMAGADYRGRRNSPEYLPEYLAVLAELRGESVEQVASQTYQNSCEVLGFKNRTST